MSDVFCISILRDMPRLVCSGLQTRIPVARGVRGGGWRVMQRVMYVIQDSGDQGNSWGSPNSKNKIKTHPGNPADEFNRLLSLHFRFLIEWTLQNAARKVCYFYGKMEQLKGCRTMI